MYTDTPNSLVISIICSFLLNVGSPLSRIIVSGAKRGAPSSGRGGEGPFNVNFVGVGTIGPPTRCGQDLCTDFKPSARPFIRVGQSLNVRLGLHFFGIGVENGLGF